MDILSAPDFAVTFGSWIRSYDFNAINTAKKIDEMAVVRMAAQSGLANGNLLRLVFMPIQISTATRTFDLSEVLLANIDRDTFVSASITDLLVTVEKAKIF